MNRLRELSPWFRDAIRQVSSLHSRSTSLGSVLPLLGVTDLLCFVQNRDIYRLTEQAIVALNNLKQKHTNPTGPRKVYSRQISDLMRLPVSHTRDGANSKPSIPPSDRLPLDHKQLQMTVEDLNRSTQFLCNRDKSYLVDCIGVMLFFGDCCGLVDFQFFRRVVNHIYKALSVSLTFVGKKNIACQLNYSSLLKSLKTFGHSMNLCVRGSLPLTVSHSKMVKKFAHRMIFTGINRAWPIRPREDSTIRELLDRVCYHKRTREVYRDIARPGFPLVRHTVCSYERPEDLLGKTGVLEAELRAYMKDLRKYLTPEELGRIRQSVKPSFNISGCIELPRSKGGAYEYYRQKIITERLEKGEDMSLIAEQPRDNVETRRCSNKAIRHNRDPCLTQFGMKCVVHPEKEPIQIDWNLFEKESMDVENRDVLVTEVTLPGLTQNSRKQHFTVTKSEGVVSTHSIWATSKDVREDIVFARRLGKILSGHTCSNLVLSSAGAFETKRPLDKIDSVTKGDWWQAVMNEAITRQVDLRLVPEVIPERGGKFRIVTKANAVCPSVLGSAHYKANELLKKIPGIREGFELRKKSPTSQAIGSEEVLRRVGKMCTMKPDEYRLNHGEMYYESDCTDSTDYIDPRYARIVLEELCALLNIKGVEREWALATIDVSGRRYIEIEDKKFTKVAKRVYVKPEDVYVKEVDDIDDEVGFGKHKISKDALSNQFSSRFAKTNMDSSDAKVFGNSLYLSSKLVARPIDSAFEHASTSDHVNGRLLCYTDEDGQHYYWMPTNMTEQDFLTLDEVRCVPSDARNVYDFVEYKSGTSVLKDFTQRIASVGRIPDQIAKSWLSVSLQGTNSESLRQMGVIPMRQRIEVRRGREVLISQYAVARGTQMGLKLSFPILCLLHHFATRESNDSVVFGDDILARWNWAKINDYEARMKELGFVLNQSKTFRSSRIGLFCGLYFDFRKNKRIIFPDVKSLVTGKVEKSLDNASPELLLKEVHNLCYMDSRGSVRDNIVQATKHYFSKILRSINSLLPAFLPEEYGGFGLLPYNRQGSELTIRLEDAYNKMSTKDRDELISQIRSNWSSTRHSVAIRNLMAIVKSSLRNLSTPQSVGKEVREISISQSTVSAKPVFTIPVGDRPKVSDVEGELEAHIMSEMQYYTDDNFSKLSIERYNVFSVVKRALTAIGHGLFKFSGHSTKAPSNDEVYYSALNLVKQRKDMHKYYTRLSTEELYLPLDQAYYISQLMDMPVTEIIRYLTSFSGIELLKNRLLLSLSVDFNRFQARKLAKARKQLWLDNLVKKINKAYGFSDEPKITVEEVWESIPYDIRSDVVDIDENEGDLHLDDETTFPSLLSNPVSGPYLPENKNWIADRNATNVGKTWAQQFIVTPKLPKIEVRSPKAYIPISELLGKVNYVVPPKPSLAILNKSPTEKELVVNWADLDYEDYQTVTVPKVLNTLDKAVSTSISSFTDAKKVLGAQNEEVKRTFSNVLKSSLVESLVNFNATTTFNNVRTQTLSTQDRENHSSSEVVPEANAGNVSAKELPKITTVESYVEEVYVYQAPPFDPSFDYESLMTVFFGPESIVPYAMGLLNEHFRNVKGNHPEVWQHLSGLDVGNAVRQYCYYLSLIHI